MAFQSPWMVRSAALRRCALKLGEGLLDRVEVSAVRREAEEASASASIISRTVGALWLDRLSMITTSLGLSSGTSTCPT